MPAFLFVVYNTEETSVLFRLNVYTQKAYSVESVFSFIIVCTSGSGTARGIHELQV